MAQRICPLSVHRSSFLAIEPAISYSQLDCFAAECAASLNSLGHNIGDCIAISAQPNWQTIALLFGAWRLKLSTALISPLLPPVSRNTYLEMIKAKLISFSSPTNCRPYHGRELDLDSTSVLILTSGSSGHPKWANLSLKALFESAETVCMALSAEKNDRWLLSLPLYHVGGLSLALRSLCSGGSIIFENKLLPYPDRIRSAQARFASIVPTQLYRLLKTPISNLTTRLLIGGAPITQNLYSRALRANLDVALTYGLTEMASSVFLSFRPTWLTYLCFLGLALPGREVKVLQEELFVKGNCLFKGYGNPPIGKTISWHPTGDMALFHERHGYAITGRKDSLFISGGENIQPEEIESAILSCPNVEEAIVVPLFDDEYGARPFAYVKTNEPIEKIREFLSSILPKYKIPIHFASFPNQENFKPDRKQFTELANNYYH